MRRGRALVSLAQKSMPPQSAGGGQEKRKGALGALFGRFKRSSRRPLMTAGSLGGKNKKAGY